MPHIEVLPNGKMMLVRKSKSGHKDSKDEKEHSKKDGKEHSKKDGKHHHKSDHHKSDSKAEITALTDKFGDELQLKERIIQDLVDSKDDSELIVEDLQEKTQAATQRAGEWRNKLFNLQEDHEKLQEQLDQKTIELSSGEKILQQKEVKLEELMEENQMLRLDNQDIKDEMTILTNTVNGHLEAKRLLQEDIIKSKENEIQLMTEKKKLEKEKENLIRLLRERDRDLAHEKEVRREALRDVEEARRETSRVQSRREEVLMAEEERVEARRREEIRREDQARGGASRREDIRREDVRRADEARRADEVRRADEARREAIRREDEEERVEAMRREDIRREDLRRGDERRKGSARRESFRGSASYTPRPTRGYDYEYGSDRYE